MKSVAQKFRASGPESGISGRLSISGRLIFDTPKSMFFIENVSKTLFFRACEGPKSRENIANGTELRDSPVSRRRSSQTQRSSQVSALAGDHSL